MAAKGRVWRYIGGHWYPVTVCPPRKAKGAKGAHSTHKHFAMYNVQGKQPGTLAQPGDNVDFST